MKKYTYLKGKKAIVSGTLAVVLMITAVSGIDFMSEREAKAGTGTASAAPKATVTGEITAKRSKFVKQFAMSDGSFTAVTYSMPVHYKKGGRWKEINTTLVKSGKTKYKTKATDLSIQVSKKANKKSLVSMKRGKTALSIALKGKKLKKSKAKVKNPKKTAYTDVRNQNKVTYKKVLKNTSISYDILMLYHFS